MTEKITRTAFIYLEPKSRDDKGTFAQCWSCRMFVPEVKGLEGSRCVIHGSKVKVDADDSCSYWVDWPTDDGEPNPEVVSDHAGELAKGIKGSVTPEESGLVDDKVQCHRCSFAEEDTTVCGLYKKLNKKLPDLFKLDTSIKTNACCNAWMEKEEDKTRLKKLYKDSK